MKFYNTLSRTKEEFIPIDKNNIRMYVCGPTVYDFIHIGNARPLIVFDVLYRTLCYFYGENSVTYVRNLTDVDDKIINKAKSMNVTIDEITSKFINEYHQDAKSLLALTPTFEPKATDHIDDMIKMIKILIEKNHAYVNDGHVFFRSHSDPNHGILSKRSVDELKFGSRVEKSELKENDDDFVLWKPAGESNVGWINPWNNLGRPGWHIECSAMSSHYLGDKFDIHGGGLDLIFPHHENEISQSTCYHGNDTMANYWLHNGFVQIDKEIISKSKGNMITLRKMFDDGIRPTVIRLALLMSHYRQPINITDELFVDAKNLLMSLNRVVDGDKEKVEFDSLSSNVLNALNDDINTPLALTELSNIVSLYRKNPTQNLKNQIYSLMEFLGLYQNSIIDIEKIESLIEERTKARELKNYVRADEIRRSLLSMDIEIADIGNKTTWKKI